MSIVCRTPALAREGSPKKMSLRVGGAGNNPVLLGGTKAEGRLKAGGLARYMSSLLS